MQSHSPTYNFWFKNKTERLRKKNTITLNETNGIDAWIQNYDKQFRYEWFYPSGGQRPVGRGISAIDRPVSAL